MNTPPAIDDATAEALLAGRGVADGHEPLQQLLVACRDAAGAPVSPRGELAAWLASGVFLDHSAPRVQPAGAGTNRRGPLGAASRKWRRIRMAIISGLATAAAKIAGASVAAKASAGVAIALASAGTAGAAGVLPETVQDRFDTVVESVTGGETPAPDPAPASDNAEFGQRVSEDARDGGVDGAEISEQARQLGEQRRPDQLPTPAAGQPAELGRPAEQGKPAEPGKPADEPPTPPTAPAASRPSPAPAAPGDQPDPAAPARP